MTTAPGSAQAGTLQGEKFPPILSESFSFPEHPSQPLCNQIAEAVLRKMHLSRCTMHPNNHGKNPHAPLPWSAMLPCTRRVLRGLPFKPRASWPPRRLRRSARRVLPAEARAASGGARRSGRRHCCGLAAEEGSRRRMAAGGVGNPGARSQRAAQITAQPAGRSGSRVCSRQLAPLLLVVEPYRVLHRGGRRRTAKPLASLSSPPSRRAESSGGWGWGMTRHLRAPH